MKSNNFPIVCVGGSAGGLDAHIRLLKNLPDGPTQPNNQICQNPPTPAETSILSFRLKTLRQKLYELQRQNKVEPG